MKELSLEQMKNVDGGDGWDCGFALLGVVGSIAAAAVVTGGTGGAAVVGSIFMLTAATGNAYRQCGLL